MKENWSNKILLASLLLAVLIIAGCKEKTPPPTPPTPQVIVITATMGEVSPTQTVVGQVKAYDEVRLQARVAGFLEKRDFVEGQVVKSGTLLFLIEQAQYKAALHTAEAEQMRAAAEQKNTTADYIRQKELYEKDAVSQRVYEQALCKKMLADAAAISAQASYDKAKLDLGYTEIRAPFDGRVGLANFSVGNLVGPESNVLADIVRLDPVRVQFNINEMDVLRLLSYKNSSGKAPALEVKVFFQDDREYKETGEITFWNNRVNPSTGTVLLQATFKNPEFILVPGMYVKVKITLEEKFQMVVIPRGALLEDQTGTYVMLINNKGIVEQRNVTIGIEQNNEVGIKSGLTPGDVIITEGLQKVRQGSPAKGIPATHSNDSAGFSSKPEPTPPSPAADSSAPMNPPGSKPVASKENAATPEPVKEGQAQPSKSRRP